LSACTDDIAKYCAGQNGLGARACLAQNADKLSAPCKTAVAALPAPVPGGTPACTHSPLCGNRLGAARQTLQRVEWKQTLGYTFTYPYVLPPGYGGVPAVALDSKGFIKTGTDLTAEDLEAAKWPLGRQPFLLETSLPGVFAVGDVRSGNMKRVASAVGEGSIAVALAHRVLAE